MNQSLNKGRHTRKVYELFKGAYELLGNEPLDAVFVYIHFCSGMFQHDTELDFIVITFVINFNSLF